MPTSIFQSSGKGGFANLIKIFRNFSKNLNSLQPFYFEKNERVDDWFRFFILRNMIELIAEHQGTIKGTIKEQFLFAYQLLYSHVQ